MILRRILVAGNLSHGFPGEPDMNAKWSAFALLSLPLCGCVEDFDHLKAIGAKLAHRTPQADKLGKLPWSDAARQLHSSLTKDPLSHRVSYRLQFDKDLADQSIHAELKGAGQIELTGYVDSANQRERAMEVASRTIGVVEVVNNLKVGKPVIAEPDASKEGAPKGEPLAPMQGSPVGEKPTGVPDIKGLSPLTPPLPPSIPPLPSSIPPLPPSAPPVLGAPITIPPLPITK